MNFCRFYNKTRIWVSKNLLDLSNFDEFEPVAEINIIIGIIVLITVVLLAIGITIVVGIPVCIIELIRRKTTSHCNLEDK